LESKFADRFKIWNYFEKLSKQEGEWFNNDFMSLDVEAIERDMQVN
jgi:hypothetical protein